METMKCEHDWVDGACGATAPAGTPGWEQRTGRNGDVFWLCPESVAEFPETTDGECGTCGQLANGHLPGCPENRSANQQNRSE